MQLYSIGKVLDTRWVSSSLRAVKAVWDSFPALHNHFSIASQDPSRDGREKATYSGLAKQLATKEFVKNLALMFDALDELSQLSLELQKRDITVLAAHSCISRQVRVLDAMSDKPGRMMIAMTSVAVKNSAYTVHIM